VDSVLQWLTRCRVCACAGVCIKPSVWTVHGETCLTETAAGVLLAFDQCPSNAGKTGSFQAHTWQ